MKMTDAEGKPINSNAARVAAVTVGVLNGWIENVQVGQILEPLKQFLKTPGAMAKALQIPAISDALLSVAKNYTGNVMKETAEEITQEAVTVIGGELAKVMSGQKFGPIDWNAALDRLKETGVESLETMAVMGLPGLALETAGAVRGVRQGQKAIEAAKKEWDSLTPAQKAEKNKEIREAIITEASKNPMFHTEEAEATRDTITKRYMDIGMDEELARAEAEVETAAGIVMLAREPDILIEKNGQKVKPTLEDMTNIVVKSWMDDVREMAEESYEQTVKHASPYKFDRFSLVHVGEGEGNQTEGYGLYYTIDNDQLNLMRSQFGHVKPLERIVAPLYDKDADGRFVNKDGTPISDAEERVLNKIEARLSELDHTNTWEFDAVQDYLDPVIDALEDDEESAAYDKIVDAIGAEKLKDDSYVYTAEIPDSDILLDYDNPLAEQPEQVKKNLEDAGLLDNWEDLTKATGWDLYKYLSQELGSDKEASARLNELGIPGMQNKSTARDLNFVIWNDSLVKILSVESPTGETESYSQIIGERGAVKLDAADAGNRIDNLGVAREMEQAGKDAKTIWLATGWQKGKEGKWNYDLMDGEIKLPDLSNLTEEETNEYESLMERFSNGEELTEAEENRLDELGDIQYVTRKENAEKYNKYTLGKIYDAPELYAAYPELRYMPVVFGKISGANGEHSNGNIYLNLDFLKNYATQKTKHVLVHEIQHAIQHIEGFAKGGSEKTGDAIRHKADIWAWRNQLKLHAENHPDIAGTAELLSSLIKEYRDAGLDELLLSQEDMEKGFNLYVRGYDGEGYEDAYNLASKKIGFAESTNDFQTYRRLSGEVQARNASARMNMTAEERRQKLLSETEDVAREDQIVLMDALEMAESYAQERTTPEQAENIRRGMEAMEKVISEQTDVMNAMYRDDVGDISFFWGETGKPPYYMNGSGISHILAKRTAEGMDAQKFVMELVDVIATGKKEEEYTRRGGRPRINIRKGPLVVVLGQVRNGEKVTWVVTGWDERVPPLKKSSSGTMDKEQGFSTATLPEATPPATGREQSGFSGQSLQQTGETVNGTTTGWVHGQPGQEAWNVPSVITFLQTANASTGFHELGHHMLRLMMDISKLKGASAQIREDVNTILTHAGVTQEEFDTDREKRIQAHEYFAMSFETYLSEGKAPTPELQGVFDRIREWMIEVYHDVVKALGIELSDEMRDVFDRLLATPDQLAEQRRIGSLAMEELARRDEMKRTAEEIKELEENAAEEATYPKDWDEITDEEGGSYPADWDEITGADDSQEEYAQIIGERGAARLDAADAGNRNGVPNGWRGGRMF